jgi:hypothetical protein
MWHRRLVSLLAALIWLGSIRGGEPALPAKVDFNRDIRPIFADACYQCHGPDKGQRKAGLRLDTRAGIFGKRSTVAPGKPEESEIYRRLVADDTTERMPRAASNKTLTSRQIALVKRWIEQGAEYKGHWAYIQPTRPQVPAAAEAGFVRNPVDRFILARLKEVGLEHAPEADRITLIRRLSFDLIGLPPTRAEVDAFVADQSPAAYEKLVDRLLASPHYGERMAMYWLDLVRYADSIGYHSDNPMNVSPYRDHVIRVFNDNQPFDRFTVEQLAGDLLPGSTREQKIASAYNRLLQTTAEGGAQPKEYIAKYAADRVRNFATVWLGSTMGCCQCHDHKFDPFTMRDFYSLEAFFADVKEPAVGLREGGLPVPSPAQAEESKRVDDELAVAKARFEAPSLEVALAQAAWERERFLFRPGKPKALDDSFVGPPELPSDVAAALAVAPDKRSPDQRKTIAVFYRSIAPALARVRTEVADLEKHQSELAKAIPKCIVTTADKPRTIRILPRGNWLDDTGEQVQPAVPKALPPLEGKGRLTRLDLAHWIVARDNPLTTRVFVNRLWKLFFGQGLTKTLDDVGAQGDWPTHPEMLDWLAVEFFDRGWDVKHMVRLLVTSGAYRQASQPTARQKELDPYNRYLARQARFRLDAEMVRDNALAVSGLLNRQIGGVSVFPYQPTGYWAALNFPPREWHNDKGDKLYRRGMYTHWQRSFPHPSLLAFDAPSREECSVDRPRSNIPQQALVLLNDPTFVEAARAFAERIAKEGGDTPQQRATRAFAEILSRPPIPAEVHVLVELYERHRTEFAADRDSANKLLHTGDHPAPSAADPVELAAWTSVARVLLNLHETVTRP